MLKGLRSIIYHVNDLEAAKKWYADILEIHPYFDEPFYVGFDIGGSELGLDPSPESYTDGNHSVAYWKTDDIEAAFEKFKSRNVQIQEEIHSVGEGMRVGTIYDPFGNLIGFIEEV